jgi:hypothetical protein
MIPVSRKDSRKGEFVPMQYVAGRRGPTDTLAKAFEIDVQNTESTHNGEHSHPGS